MKCIIQIPAYNEEKTLPLTLSKLPKKLPGISTLEYLIINDGSSDSTTTIAKENGVHHIINFIENKGLAKAFCAGIDYCLKQNADIIVNTDADNQYNADDIEKLIEPIIKKQAEIVIGERPIATTKEFSWTKKKLQKLGSFVVRKISGTNIKDAPSGFRAISRNAALQINIFNEYTYTIEMIIQAGRKGIPTLSIPIRTNKAERPSKLVKSIPSYIKRSLSTMVRIFNTYKPLYTFLIIGIFLLLIGIILGLRWILLYMGEGQALHIPSLILTAIFIVVGSQFCIFGLVADLVSVNRKLLEDIQYKIRQNYYK